MRSIHLTMLYQDYKEAEARLEYGEVFLTKVQVSAIYTRRINQYSYKDTLEKCLKQLATFFYGRSKNWIFQQDGTTTHTAHSIQYWFNEKGYKVFPWCA